MTTLEQAILANQQPEPKSLDTLLSELRHLNIRLWTEGDRLRYKAATGTLTPELLAQLRDRKVEIVEFLKAASLAADPSAANIPAIPRDGHLPLSISQERLWYHHQFDPDSSLNNIITAYRINGNLDLELLDRAQHEIAQRHEILRTTFPTVDGMPTIKIAPEWELSIPLEDLQQIGAAERDEVAYQRASAECRRAYDLETGPLFRLHLFQLEPDKYILVLTMHRMMADGISVDIVFRELVTHYQAYLLDRAVVLPELPIQYIDYAHWQRQRVQGEFLDRHLRYWKEHLQAPLPQLKLPISRPRPATYCFNTQRRRLIFPKQLHNALNTLSKAEEATLFMTLMAAFKVLLYPYAEGEDVMICCSNAGRNRAEIEHAIGPFFNSLVLRTNLSGNPTFRETLAREKQVALGAFAHQDLPFEQLVPELDTSGNKGRSSLFQVFFALNPSWTDGNTLYTVELPGVTFYTMTAYLHRGKSKFDLFLVAREAEQGLQLLFEYNSDLFDPEVIFPIMDRFQTLLENIVANPDRPIAELSVLTPVEQQQLVVAAAIQAELPAAPESIAIGDDCELEITKIWERVLDVAPIGIADNFFDLGGNSLTAVRLFAEIATTFEKNLPLSMLLKAPTIGQLAAVIRQDVAADIWSPLVEIKPGGAKSPLFCIHGGGFNILVYRDLALQLDADLPVYGLQARGLDRQQPLADRLEAMATDYINEIQRVQPVGPYLLAGLSNGGNIALEMAQQLHARGETVALLAMFDSYAPAGITLLSPVPRFLSSLSYALKYSAPRSISKLRQAGVKQMAIDLKTTIDRLFRAKTPTDEPAANLDPPDLQPHSNENAIERNLNRVSNYILEHSPWSFFSPSAQLQTSQAPVAETLKQMERYYSKIYKTYAPQPYPGKITIFQAIEPPPGYQRDPYLGWGEIAQGGVEIYKIPGNHTSMMESPILPEQMNICLDRVIDEYGLS
jgi:thioesterase domain-containing protein/acyl carrier protein